MKKKNFMLACMAMAVGMGTAYAAESEEKDYRPYPHMFVGLNGGAQVSFSNYDFGKLIVPSYGVQFGAYFNPVVGARLHVGGYQNKGGLKSVGDTYDFNTVTGSADLLLNVTNMFRENKDGRFNFILLGGVGLAGAWDNDDFHALAAKAPETYPFAWEDNRFSHNVRVGMQFDVNIVKHFGMNLEIAANNRADRINSKTTDRDDWNASASLGLIFKFGHKKAEKKQEEQQPVAPVETWATRTDTVWYDDVTYKEVPVQESMEETIHYDIRMSEPVPDAQVQAIAKFVKEHKNSKISVTSYSDKGTGTPKVNMKYSKERAEKVVAALVAAGIDKGIITSAHKGDTEQPFTENDKNRATIVKVTGEGVKKEPVTTKKFRLEEKRYKVEQ